MQIAGFIVVCLLVIGEAIWMPLHVKKKLVAIIQAEGGEIIRIQLISSREFIYSVYYLKNGEKVRKVARYNLGWGIEWL